jgi:hypothetical protein
MARRSNAPALFPLFGCLLGLDILTNRAQDVGVCVRPTKTTIARVLLEGGLDARATAHEGALVEHTHTPSRTSTHGIRIKHHQHVCVYDFTRGVERGGDRGWRGATTLERGDETRGVEKPRAGDDDGRESERRRGRMMGARGLSTLDGFRTVHVAHGGVSADDCRTRWLRV